MKRVVITLAVFLALIALLAVGLRLNPREVPSPLVGKPAPAFSLPQLYEPGKSFSNRDMAGKVWLLNVWASWCVACREEHPVLLDLARAKTIPIYGLNYKDERKDGIPWLRQMGDPYVLSIYDIEGRLGIDYGVYGVPETFLIDKKGVIRYKRIGPVTEEVLKEKILPMAAELERE
jgi:cytochrome c biogenesis protein CcmG, thiol:disulfide interchange protein DsbE